MYCDTPPATTATSPPTPPWFATFSDASCSTALDAAQVGTFATCFDPTTTGAFDIRMNSCVAGGAVGYSKFSSTVGTCGAPETVLNTTDGTCVADGTSTSKCTVIPPAPLSLQPRLERRQQPHPPLRGLARSATLCAQPCLMHPKSAPSPPASTRPAPVRSTSE